MHCEARFLAPKTLADQESECFLEKVSVFQGKVAFLEFSSVYDQNWSGFEQRVTSDVR